MGDLSDGAALEAEICWFERLLDVRFRIHGGELEDGDPLALAPPPPLALGTAHGDAVAGAGFGAAERLVLILAALPHLRPQALDPLLIPNQTAGRPFTEFGGAPAGGRNGFRPTRETALFLLAGENMDRRLAAMRLFDPDGALERARLLDVPDDPDGPGPWTPLVLACAWLGRIAAGAAAPPRFGPAFPAQRLETAYGWDDLVLPNAVLDELDDLKAWIAHERVLMEDWGLRKHLKPGYRALFHGPPGTGKTVTAAVLGGELGLPVYRVDLSRVVSKWIGETEKNLALLFDMAAESRMILFFDEADALFGKRGDTRSANDRHANQQISYLLQRIEECPGVVILASNLKGNIDEAFARRFQAMVHFPMPDAAGRERLWRGVFAGLAGSAAIDFAGLARDHDLAGGAIVNVLRSACVHAVADGEMVTAKAVLRGVERERGKDGRLGY